jgi:predicted transcriptional regulator
LTPTQAKELCRRVAAGESKTALAQELGISRQTLYRYIEGAREVTALRIGKDSFSLPLELVKSIRR